MRGHRHRLSWRPVVASEPADSPAAKAESGRWFLV